MSVATCKMGETNTPTRDQSLKQRKGEQIKKRTKQLVEYLLYPNSIFTVPKLLFQIIIIWNIFDHA